MSKLILNILGSVCILVGLSLLIVDASISAKQIFVSQSELMPLSNELLSVSVVDDELLTVIPKKISLPVNNMVIPIEVGYFDGENWSLSDDSAIYASPSAGLGEGNTIVYGHNTSEVFGSLSKLNTGDEIVVYGTDEEEFIFVVENILVVNPNEVWILRPTPNAMLTIYTCTGFLDSKRLVVQASLVSSNKEWF